MNLNREAPPSIADWTVMVHMSTDNKLPKDCIDALIEMYRVRVGPDINVVAQYESGAVIRQFEISRDRNVKKFKKVSKADRIKNVSDEIFEAPDVKLAEPENEILSEKAAGQQLEEFLLWCIKHYPSKRYLLVLSGYSEAGSGFASGSSFPSRLALLDVGKALYRVREELHDSVDVVGLDCCVMSAAETCYELRNSVKYLVGSEGFEPGTGWPLRRIIKVLNNNPEMEPAELARNIVDKYIRHYSNYVIAGVSVHQAAYDLTRVRFLADAIKNLAKILISNLSDIETRNAILLAHLQAQSYGEDRYIDLKDFCLLLLDSVPKQEEVRHACTMVMAAVKECVLISGYIGNAFQHSNGFSIYFPRVLPEDLDLYHNLGFNRDTDWSRFLSKETMFLRQQPRQAIRAVHPEKWVMEDLLGRVKHESRLQSKGIIEETAGEIEQRIGKQIESALVGPTLDNYRGFICATVNDQKGQKLTLAEDGMYRATTKKPREIVIWLQPGQPEQDAGEAVDIRDGQLVDPVTFEVNLDSDFLTLTSSRKEIKAPLDKPSEHAIFPLTISAKSPLLEVWVQLFQKNRLIQVLPIKILGKKQGR
jgi:hypothetical protein